MTRNRLSLSYPILVFLLFSLSLFRVPAAQSVEVESTLTRQVDRDETTGYLIFFKDRADLSKARTMGWRDRGRFAMQALKGKAKTAQERVRRHLNAKRARYRSFWIDNIIVVEKSDRATFNALKAFHEIASIQELPIVELHDQMDQRALQDATLAVEPNISHVKADQVWALGIDGTGIVVASIDTGVRYTHQALLNQYRGNLGGGAFDHNYSWFDPTGICGGTPCDNNDHGTHTMGTIVGYDGGANRIGMAPGAQWIACKACASNSCSASSLLECGQFIAAPTDLAGNNPDPSKRPHVVNNSWGGAGGNSWYQTVVNNWQAAGIYPVFSNGNSGPACGSVSSPADYANVTGVGATYYTNDQPASFSSRGPSVFADTINPLGYAYLKPQVSAPGVNIRSAVGTLSDNSYMGGWSGTSMAAPHVSGLVALMLQAAPCLTYGATETIIMQTATPVAYASECGGEGPGNVPNNATGWGVIDALAAVNEVLGACEPHEPRVQGTVRDGSGQGWPLGAAITISSEGFSTTVTTDPLTGQYTANFSQEGLPYTFEASAPGYTTEMITTTIGTGVTTVDFTLTVDVDLCDAPGYSASKPLSENFDKRAAPPRLPPGWAVEPVDGTDGAWATSAGAAGGPGVSAHSSPNLVYFNSLGVHSGSMARIYRATGVNLSRMARATLSFWMYHDPGFPGYDDRVQPQVSINRGVTWLDVGNPVSRYDGTTGWQRHLIDIGHFTGSGRYSVRIALLGVSEGGNDIYIDDIAVVGPCVPGSGGLIVGGVLDDTTNIPLQLVSLRTGRALATTDELGLYTLFSPAGYRGLRAIPGLDSGYGAASALVRVLKGGVIRKDFRLPCRHVGYCAGGS
jgi:subtilisin family serine protease